MPMNYKDNYGGISNVGKMYYKDNGGGVSEIKKAYYKGWDGAVTEVYGGNNTIMTSQYFSYPNTYGFGVINQDLDILKTTTENLGGVVLVNPEYELIYMSNANIYDYNLNLIASHPYITILAMNKQYILLYKVDPIIVNNFVVVEVHPYTGATIYPAISSLKIFTNVTDELYPEFLYMDRYNHILGFTRNENPTAKLMDIYFNVLDSQFNICDPRYVFPITSGFIAFISGSIAAKTINTSQNKLTNLGYKYYGSWENPSTEIGVGENIISFTVFGHGMPYSYFERFLNEELTEQLPTLDSEKVWYMKIPDEDTNFYGGTQNQLIKSDINGNILNYKDNTGWHFAGNFKSSYSPYFW